MAAGRRAKDMRSWIIAGPGLYADWLKGVESREVIPNVAYFIRDPEGDPVELYTPPKP